MLNKTYALFYKNGKWYIRNYGRVLKKGGYFFGRAHFKAWYRNVTGATPIIDLKRIVPRPGPKEDYKSFPLITSMIEDEIAEIHPFDWFTSPEDHEHEISFKAPSAPLVDSGVQPSHSLPENETYPANLSETREKNDHQEQRIFISRSIRISPPSE